MSLDTESLYRLLPAVHRLRDDAQGNQLRQLIGLIARELGVLEENIEQLYDDQFIETCEEWVAPYIGELVGYRPLHGVAPRVASPRAEVANTIKFRRRKGTALMLEQLASDVTGWPSHAVEFFEQLCTTQYMNHARPHALATAPVRSQGRMLTAGGPFNAVSHTVEVRRPEAGSGRYNIPNIGIFLWRLQPFRLSSLPLVVDPADPDGRRCRLNPLGTDLALFRRPESEDDIDHLAEARNVPEPLSVREFALQVRAATDTPAAVSECDDYGIGRSVVITRNGAVMPLKEAGPVDPEQPNERLVVRIADLRDVFDGGGNFAGWAHEDDIGPQHIALDPSLGRVLLGTDRATEHASAPFVATFHYAMSRPIGGGQYERTPANVADAALPQLTVAQGADLQAPLDTLESTGGRLLVDDSLTFPQTPAFKVAAVTAEGAPGLTVVAGARNGARPLIAATGEVALEIGARGTLVLDGLVIAGGTLRLAAAADNETRTLVLRDCTLVPGLAAAAPSLSIEHPFTTLRLERCIVGPVHIVAENNVAVELEDCVVDATDPESFAFAGDAAGAAGGEVSLRQCTVLGKVHTRVLRLASNCIFVSQVSADRKQEGCMRFSFAAPGSITPRRFQCQPDAGHPHVRPHFTSLRFGDPGYCQLLVSTSRLIREGGEGGGEMGVMHPLFQPQRETNLRIRLDEYLRFGLRAGLFYAT